MHGDIKGENILIFKNDIIKLSDMGSARKIGNMNMSLIGTMGFLAPEILNCKAYGRFADVWSLGCTVYEMLTGELPFKANHPTEIERMIKNFRNNYDFLQNDNISKNSADFIKCCLKFKPWKRTNVYELLNHPFICLGLQHSNVFQLGNSLCHSKFSITSYY